MIKSNAILILKSFTNDELRQFNDFLNSPFHNKNSKVVELFEFIHKFHPNYNDASLTKEKLFEAIFGKSAYRESYIRNLFSDLNILAEKFLQYQHINKNHSFEKILIEELCRRNIDSIAEKKIRNFEKEILKDKVKDQEYYLNKLFLYDARSLLIVDKSLTDSFRNDQLISIIKSFMISLMETSFYLFVEEQRVNIKHNFDLLKIILDYIKNNRNEFSDSPLLIIFYHLCSCMLEADGERHYVKAKNLLHEKFHILSKPDKKNIYSVLQTYCINRIDRGDPSYNRELLDILIEMLKFKVTSHSEKDIININLYRNVMMLCHTLNEAETLKMLTSKYVSLVDEESRQSISDYSYAYLNFQQKNFAKALEFCNRIDFNKLLVTTNENLYFKNDIKRLSLMCLYELNYFENVLSQTDAFRHFLRNSKLIKEINRRRLNGFLNNVNELVRLRINYDSFKLHKFREKLLEGKDLIAGKWLLEKVGEIEKRIRQKKQ